MAVSRFSFRALLASLMLCAPLAMGQITVSAVTDGGGFGPRVAPGSLATIFGSGIALATQNASSFPLPTSMGGAKVIINQTAVPLVYVSPGQINFQVPQSLTAGKATLYVAIGSNTSANFQFTVTAAAPAIFRNKDQAAAQNNDASHTANTPKTPAASGSVVTVYLTGLGAVSNPVPDGSPALGIPLSQATAKSSATIGGLDAPVQFLGLAPGFAGLGQANLTVPNLPNGTYPAVITVGGLSAASAMISVSGTGTPNPAILSRVGQINFANTYASEVAVNGNYTYVCALNRIHIINTSDVTNPAYSSGFGDAQLNGQGGDCTLNTVVSPPILVDIVGPPIGASSSASTSGPTFAVFNVNTPNAPSLLSQTGTQCSSCFYLTGLSFVNTVAFTSTSWYQFDGSSNIIAQHGDFLAYDFSNPYTPFFISLLQTGPGSNNVNLKTKSLVIPSASTPTPTVAYASSTTASGSTTSGSAVLDVINIATPSSMSGIGTVTVPQAALFFSFAYDHNLLLVTGNTKGLTTPGPNFGPNGMLTLTTLDVSNIQSPSPITTLVTTYPTMGTYHAAALGNSFFAIVNDPAYADPLGPSTLLLVDARTPKTPVVYPLISQFGLNGVQVVTNSAGAEYFLVSDIQGLSIYKVTLP